LLSKFTRHYVILT